MINMAEKIQQLEKRINVLETKIIQAYTTKTDNYNNETIDTNIARYNHKGNGRIDQILLKTTSNDFNVTLNIDDNGTINESYTNLYTLSDQLRNISAFLDGGYYYLSIRNMFFSEYFELSIITTSSVTFTDIRMEYTIRNEKFIT